MTSVDLLLHPVRLRIVQAFLGDRALTTSALGAELADIPATTLYRHVARLVEADILTIVDQRQVRGTLERTYVLRLDATAISPDDLAEMNADDHRQAFMAYVAGLLGTFDHYLDRGDIDLPRDGVGYGMTGIWLDDTELAALRRDIQAVLRPHLANPPGPDRRRRILATILLPGEGSPPVTSPAPNEDEQR
jgi:hypothetical protein